MGEAGPKRGLELDSPVNTLLTVLTSVNRDCERLVRESRVVGFRVSRAAWLLYNEVLSDADKELIKYAVEGFILAIARHRLGSLPCEELLGRRLQASATRLSGGGAPIFNVSISVSQAEAKAEARLDLDRLWELVEKLYKLMESSSRTPPTQLKLVREIREMLRNAVSN